MKKAILIIICSILILPRSENRNYMGSGYFLMQYSR